VIAQLVSRKTGRDAVESAVIGFAAAQSNTVLIGIPLILRIYGEAGSVPIVLLLVVHLPVTMTIVSLLVARSAGGGSGGSALALIRALVTHPILLAIFAGILWRWAGLPIPPLLASILKFLGDAAAPCALVAMGMTLSSVSLRGSLALISLIAGLKLVLHPVLVFLLAHYVFHLPPLFVGVAILFAACPTGVNAFLVADRYKAGEAMASGAIAVTTLLAIFTMTLAVSFISTLK
jgi:malonate transporter and related proteins